MAASPFERQVIEDDATDDRTQARPDMADGPQQYQPSPSFLDHDRPAIRLVALPAWLQAFASAVGEPSESEALAAPESSPSEQPVSSTSPDPKNPAPAQSKTTGQTPPSNPSSDFITEDDLPEWLRSIAPEDTSDPSFDALAIGDDESREQITVPNITRAWSTSKDARGVDETTSLFALIASQAPQTALPDQSADGMAEVGGTSESGRSAGPVGAYGTERPPSELASIEMPASAPSEDAEGEVSGGFPVLPMVVAAVLLIALLGAAAVMFLFL